MKPMSNLSRRAAICTGASALALAASPLRASSIPQPGSDEAHIEVYDITGVAEVLAQAVYNQVMTLPGGLADTDVRISTKGDSSARARVASNLQDRLHFRGVHTFAPIVARGSQKTFVYASSKIPERMYLTREQADKIIANTNTKIFMREESLNVVMVSLEILPSATEDVERVLMTSSSGGGTFAFSRMMNPITGALTDNAPSKGTVTVSRMMSTVASALTDKASRARAERAEGLQAAISASMRSDPDIIMIG